MAKRREEQNLLFKIGGEMTEFLRFSGTSY
jgi:hypothetical protein